MIKQTIISLSITFMILGGWLLLPTFFHPNLFIHHSAEAFPLYRDQSIAQSVTPDYPLHGIVLKFKKTNTNDHPLSVEVGRLNTNKPYWEGLLKTEVRVQPLVSDQEYVFYFDKPLMAHQSWVINLSANVASESASISPYVSNLDTYEGGQAYVSSHPLGQQSRYQPAEVWFQPVYKLSGFEQLKYYLHRVSFAKPLPKVIVLVIFMIWLASLILWPLWLGLRYISSKQWVSIGLLIFILFLVMLIFFYHHTPTFLIEESAVAKQLSS